MVVVLGSCRRRKDPGVTVSQHPCLALSGGDDGGRRYDQARRGQEGVRDRSFPGPGGTCARGGAHPTIVAYATFMKPTGHQAVGIKRGKLVAVSGKRP